MLETALQIPQGFNRLFALVKIFTVLLLSALSPGLLAQSLLPSWVFEPGVRLDLFYDDNVRLSEVEPQSSFGGFAELYAVMSRSTEVSDLRFRGVVDTSYYTDVSELNSTDGALEAYYIYRMERTTFGLDSRLIYDSTLTSEEETTGIVQVNKRRTFFDISPSIDYALSERATIGLDFTFQDVSYEDASEILLSDYQFFQAGLNGEYDLTERVSILARLLYDRFDSEQRWDRSDAYGGEAGFRYEISDRMTLTALAGGRSVEQTSDVGGQSITTSSSGPMFSVSLNREYGPGEIDITLARSLLPSGRGTLLDTTRAGIALSFPVTERAIARLDLAAVRNRNPGNEINFNDRDFFLVTPGFRWLLSESTWLDVSYRYRYQDREIIDGNAQSNAVYIGFAHDWKSR